MIVTPNLKIVLQHINCPEAKRGDRDPLFQLKHLDKDRAVIHCTDCGTQVLLEMFEPAEGTVQ
jgi:hypothetical protein